MDDEWERRQRAQAAGFDTIGARYDEVFAHKDGQVDTAALLLRELPPGARVLDVGCGTGLPTAGQLVGGGCAVTGIDISPVMLDLARANVPGARFARRDAVEVAPDLGTFDAVVAFFSLLMLPRAQVVETLAHFREVLTPDGWVALGMVEGDLDDVTLPFLGVPVRVTGWPRDELRQLVTNAGFRVEVQDARWYRPPVPVAPTEIQLFLLARNAP
jgi:SAM-dependent methyltransferase